MNSGLERGQQFEGGTVRGADGADVPVIDRREAAGSGTCGEGAM
jgi:hypothetical protein